MALLIRNGLIMTPERADVRVERGTLRIERDHISEVVYGEKAHHVFVGPADRVINAGRHLVIPGLVDAHAHLYGTIVPGLIDRWCTSSQRIIPTGVNPVKYPCFTTVEGALAMASNPLFYQLLLVALVLICLLIHTWWSDDSNPTPQTSPVS